MSKTGKSRRYRTRAVISLIFLAIGLCSCERTARQPAANEQKGLIKVVVVTGGHEFERKPFLAMFDSFKNINYAEAEQKNDSEIFEDIDEWDYDVIVLFNMTQEISPQRRKNFTALLERGTGLLALHHSIGAFQKWPEYRRIIGAKSYLETTVEDGKTYPACGFLHDIDYNIKVEDAGHPITQGLRDFAVHDETYNNCVYEADNRLLLSTDHPTSDKPLGWVRNYGKSNVCYIQMGHGPEIFANDNYRRLVAQAIEWCAGGLKQD